jgi:hypothetical protein
VFSAGPEAPTKPPLDVSCDKFHLGAFVSLTTDFPHEIPVMWFLNDTDHSGHDFPIGANEGATVIPTAPGAARTAFLYGVRGYPHDFLMHTKRLF